MRRIFSTHLWTMVVLLDWTVHWWGGILLWTLWLNFQNTVSFEYLYKFYWLLSLNALCINREQVSKNLGKKLSEVLLKFWRNYGVHIQGKNSWVFPRCFRIISSKFLRYFDETLWKGKFWNCCLEISRKLYKVKVATVAHFCTFGTVTPIIIIGFGWFFFNR